LTRDTLRVALFGAILCTAVQASAQFEGIVQSRNFTLDDEGAGQHFEMTIWVRRDMIRIRIPGVGATPGSTVIYRHDRKMSWVINETDKTFFEVSHASQQPEQMQRDQDPDKPQVERTKRTRKILGYTCEQVILRRGESETEIWGTGGLGDLSARLDSLLGGAQGGAPGNDQELLGQLHLFPLVSVTRYGGEVIDSQEVTKIERRSLDPNLFVIPAEYKKQASMESME